MCTFVKCGWLLLGSGILFFISLKYVHIERKSRDFKTNSEDIKEKTWYIQLHKNLHEWKGENTVKRQMKNGENICNICVTD